MYYSSDNGGLWRSSNDELSDLRAVAVSDKNLYFARVGEVWVGPLSEVIVGIEQTLSFSSASVFPNPASDVAYLNLSSPTDCFVSYKIFNSSGKLLISEFQDANEGKIVIDLKSFTPGPYILKATFCDKTIYRRILVK